MELASIPHIASKWLGEIDYISGVRAVDNEEKEFAARETLDLKINCHTVFGMEHPLTITLGKRADPLKDIRANVRVLKERGVQIVGVDRGGQATLHNPGQLVIYPHIHLPTWGLGVRDFVNCLQLTTQKLLEEFGVVARPGESEPGLFTEQGKIAFFGLRIKKGWSSHGLALNVDNNLEDFGLIRACGHTHQPISRLSDLVAVKPALAELFNKWCQYFQSVMADTVAVRSLTTESDRPMFNALESQPETLG